MSLDRIAALRGHCADLQTLFDQVFREDGFDAAVAGYSAATWGYLLGRTLSRLEVDLLRLERDLLEVELAGRKPIMQQEVEDWLVQTLLHQWGRWQSIPNARPTIDDLLHYVPTVADVADATSQSRTTIWRRLGHAMSFAAVRAARLDAARDRAVSVLLDRGRSVPACVQAEMATPARLKSAAY
jgi:hypothetical protein